MRRKLTAKGVENETAGSVRKEVPDGLLPGLFLLVQPSGAKSFAVRYRHAGRPRKLTLGSYPAVDLAGAREMGAKALRAAAEGRDPASEKQTAKIDAAADKIRGQHDLFENIAREFVKRYAMKSTRESSWWETARILGLRSNPENPDELIAFKGKGLKVLSVWEGRRVQDITKRDVIALLDRIADGGSPIMANRTLAAVRKLFNWCVSRDIIPVSPCNGIEPPGQERSRDRVLSDQEIKLVWKATDVEGWPFGPLVKLLVLTGQRLTEVGAMRWEEFDLENKMWTLAPERTKNGNRHQVPLSDAAFEIINAVPRVKTTKGFVFTTSKDVAVSGFSRAKERIDAAIAAALPTGAEPPAHWTFHDLRRSMASGMAGLGIQLPVIERVLNHISGTFRGVVGVYQHHDFAKEKREALDLWGDHIAKLVADKRS
jgi:integrase